MKSRIVFALAIGLVLFSCRSANVARGRAPDASPSEAGAAARPQIALGRVENRIPAGTLLGGELDEFQNLGARRFFASAHLSPDLEKLFLAGLAHRLEARGFALAELAEVFGEDASWRADLRLESALLSLELKQNSAGERPRYSASAVVEWRVLAPEEPNPIHVSTTSGSASAAESLAGAELAAYLSCAERFLAQAPIDRLFRYRREASPAAAILGEKETIALPARRNHSGRDIETVLAESSPAVFSIRTANGHGSGFFIRPDGTALTAQHVVAGRRTWDALLSDGRMVRLRVLRESPQTDLALVRAEMSDAPYLEIGESGSLRAGEELFSIATPVSLGLSRSVSRGIVSAIRPESSRTLIQTDLAMNPGSSGGPVLNRRGEVVGVVGLKLRASEIEGVGFFIAVNDARSALLLTESKP